jgi:Family of unknown function (DUF6220)
MSSTMRAVVTRLVHGLAWLVLAGLAGEFYLAGAALFGVTTFQPHRTLGAVLAGAILLLPVPAPVARPGRRVLGLAALLAALAVVQAALPRLQPGLPAVAALHVVNAAALLAVTGAIARGPGRAAVVGRSPAAPAAVVPGTRG